MDRGHHIQRKKHPRETTNIISLIFFFYTIKIFKKAYFEGLEFENLYDVLRDCRSKELGDKLEERWKQERSKHKKPSFTRTLILSFGKRLLVLGLMQFAVRLTMTIWLPHAKSKLISYFNPGQTTLTIEDAVYFAYVVIGLNVFNLIFIHNFNLYVLALGLGVKAAVSSLLYRTSLRLNCEALSDVTVGKITTIINRDVEIFQQFVAQGNDMWISLVQTLIICFLIYQKIGLASWAGVTFFFIILPLQMFIGKLAYSYRLKCSKKTDERLEITQEVLSAIKIIKMYTWEKYFEEKICDARKKELKALHKLFYSRIWIYMVGSVCSKVAFFIFLMTYVWMDNTVTAETVYYILACFGDLEGSLNNSIPSGFSKAAEAYAIIKRCETILICKEMAPKTKTGDIVCPHIFFSNASIKIAGKPVLNKVNLNINEGLHIIVGSLGSGHTTLLKAIMDECEISGSHKILGTVSYASQEPWLFPSSIKNNIVFGEEYVEKRYKKILKICSLDYDLDLIEEGDNTIIGDRGINLSKGQQTRINLARALYKDSDIYLLDDCLATLDAHVSDHIFKNIKKLLENKICVFVTNNLTYMQEADKIITLEEGTLKCSDNFDKVLSSESVRYEFDQIIKPGRMEESSPLYHETKKGGKVSQMDYYYYVLSGGGMIVFSLILALFTMHQGASSYSEKLLSNWVTLEQNVSNFKDLNQTFSFEYKELYEGRTGKLTLYCAMFGTAALLYLSSCFAYFFFIKEASINLHRDMLNTVINTTMKFFDFSFIGTVLTRFSKDCVTVDEYLPSVLIECLRMIFVVFGGVILLTSVNILFLIECFMLFVVAYLIKRFCQPAGRNLQRLHVMARCPMVGHVHSSLTGLSVIRSSNVEEMIVDEFDRYQDQFTSTHYMLDNSLIALSFSLELACAILIASIIVQFLVSDSDHSIGDVGLAIGQAFTISSIITNGIRVISDCENLMTSVERILEYVRLEQEDKKGTMIKNWPKTGAITFNEVSLTYGKNRHQLKDVSFTITSKEKLGIVGRTGAGKSSIIASLLRLYDAKGAITIDGVDIKDVSLACLRSNISVIPQDSFIFSGSIRENLDPLEKHSDDEIWKILSDLNLKKLIQNLNDKVDKGFSVSAGQQQLLCLARIILRKNKIIILDEATANLDQKTERKIYEAVRHYFADCTVITIAHRVVSVMDCNKVIVLQNGEIRECGDPKKLMESESSLFYSVVK